MSIRPYRSEDKPVCLAIFDSNRPTYFTTDEREQFIEWLEHPDREAYYVLEDSGQVVACGGIFYDSSNDTVGLAWGMVHAAFHRKGYGSQLTKYRLAQLQHHYADKVQVIDTSQHTVAFYKRMGFEVVRMEKNGFGEGLDRYDMVRSPLPKESLS